MPATGVAVELQLGGWADVTTDILLRDRIKIGRGRSDQAARVDPGSATFSMRNPDGRYSPRNPLSPYFGLIGRNTPARISVPGPTAYLGVEGTAADYATTPDTAALRITGDIDVRVEVDALWRAGGTPQTLIGKWGATAADQSWLLRLNGGAIEFDWTSSVDGFQWAAVQPVPDELPARAAVRATLDVSNGSGGFTAALYWAPSISGPWTQFYSGATAGSMAILPGTADVRTGPADPSTTPNGQPFEGRVYAAEVRSGIGGTVVAAPSFTSQPVGTTTFADSAGRTWTLHGAARITNRRYRFRGELASLPQRSDPTGGDVWTPVQAAGIRRRLGRPTAPLDSTLRRRIPTEPTILGYWPMEDGQGSTRAASGLSGGKAATFSGVSWAADDSLAGSSPLPTIAAGTSLSAPVPGPSGTMAGWHVEFVYRADTLPAGTVPFINVQLSGGTYSELQVTVAGTTFGYAFLDASGNPVTGSTMAAPNAVGQWCRFIAYGSASGTTVNLHLAVVTIGGDGYQSNFSYTGKRGNVSRVYCTYGTGLAGMRMGHLGVFGTPGTGIFNNADRAFAGESAGARIVRLCAEEGIPLVAPDGIAGTAPMGPQRPGALLDLLDEAAAADVGSILGEDRDRLALAFRPRASLYNQSPTLTIDYTDTGLSTPLEQDDDDTGLINDMTVSRPSGSSARAEDDTGTLSVRQPPAGVGRYPSETSLNVSSDDQLPDIAAWLVHIGAWDEGRFPAVSINLTAAPALVDTATAVDSGDRLTIANPPVWLSPGTISLLAEGYSETIGEYDWTTTYNSVPEGPYRVAVLDDTVLGRVDTDGSQLNTAVTATATTLTVKVTAGPLWTTNAAEYPLDLIIGGEVVTATGCTGSTSPQTMTVIRGVNGIAKPQAAGTDVRLANPMILAL